jgi:hypothetical protein
VRTAGANFGGGNTAWEEQSLGSYARSETRYLEIMDHVCDKDNGGCHSMLEDNEDAFEAYWKIVYGVLRSFTRLTRAVTTRSLTSSSTCAF